MSAALQELAVDAVVLLAAGWLVWSFGPESWRARLTRGRAAPSYDAALHADGLDGRADATPSDCDCGR